MTPSNLPVGIAHRGASFYCPENTIEAFKHAHELGSEHLECDCWLTKDHEIVVIHDASLDRTTDLTGEVSSKTLEEIKQGKMHACSTLSQKAYVVPTLREILSFISGKDLKLYIELKDPNLLIVDKTMQLLEELQLEKQVVIISFEHHLLQMIAQKYPHIKIGFSQKHTTDGLLEKAKKHSAQGVVIHHELLESTFVDEATLKGLDIWVYTVKNAQELMHCLKYTISGYFVDQPDLHRIVEQDKD